MKTELQRRYAGKFYTPLPFVEKALEFIESALGTNWWTTGKYRLWDMAAGIGNLESGLPSAALQYCYLSTIDYTEMRELQKRFPEAAVFQYDYLNDDTAQLFVTKNPPLNSDVLWKMPAQLQKDLDDTEIQWIVLVNPPYATAQDAAMSGKTKDNVADTVVRQKMHEEKLGEVSRELYTQFLYRIQTEFKNKKTYLGIFAPLKYLVSNNYQKFRDKIFLCSFQTGFVFSSENFGGTSAANSFPVSFIFWDLNKKQKVDLQKIALDVLNNNAEKIGSKSLRFTDRSQFLNRWVNRPPATLVFPPFSSALNIKEGNKDTRNRIAEDFLASLMCPGNELQCQQKTVLLSGPQASAGAFSVTPDNFEQAMVVFAARRVPQNCWLNHVDQFWKPNRELPQSFINDCTVWTLFDSKNQTVAMRNVKYQDKIYQIKNHFFPFPFSGLRHWNINNAEMRVMLENTETLRNSFVSDYLKKQAFSPFLCQILEAAESVYRFYFNVLEQLPLSKYKIETCDAGWRQITLSLHSVKLGIKEQTELKVLHEQLKKKILPQLLDYKIISSI